MRPCSRSRRRSWVAWPGVIVPGGRPRSSPSSARRSGLVNPAGSRRNTRRCAGAPGRGGRSGAGRGCGRRRRGRSGRRWCVGRVQHPRRPIEVGGQPPAAVTVQRRVKPDMHLTSQVSRQHPPQSAAGTRACGTPLRHPPRSAGSQPAFPDRGFSHRTAYTSFLAANNAPKSVTLALDGDLACTNPGGASNIPDCPGLSGAAARRVSFSRRSSRAFSARSRANFFLHRRPLAARGLLRSR